LWGSDNILKQTPDSGFVIAGNLGPNICLVKTNSTGDVQWAKIYDGVNDASAYGISLTSDDGYIVSGYTESFLDTNGQDMYLIKADSTGDIVWTKSYGGQIDERAYGVQQSTDGGYIVLGAGENILFVGGYSYTHLIKTDANGNSDCNEKATATVVTDTTVTVTSGVIPENIATVVTNTSSTVTNEVITDSALCAVVGMNEIHNFISWILYPNPFNNSATLIFKNSKNESHTLTLYDIHGRLVQTINDITTNRVEIERKNLTNGLYFFQLRTDREVLSTGKLIIE